MKLLLTGLLYIVLTSGLFEQEKINMPPDFYFPSGQVNKTDVLVAPKPESTPFKPDYQLRLDLGYGSGDGEISDGMFIAEVVNGFLLSPNFFLGLGTGLRLHSQSSDFWGTTAYPTIPVYLDAILFLSKGRVSPYISLDAGYTYDVSWGITDLGFMINPMAGFSFSRDTKNPLHLGVGYNSQIIKNYHGNNSSGPEDKNLGSLVVIFGVTIGASTKNHLKLDH